MKAKLATYAIAMLVLAGVFVSPPTLADDKVYTQQEVMISMSDDVPLGASVYIPTGVEQGPTILVRTPYGKNSKSWLVEPLTNAGYVVVVQDVRGMNSSKGQFIPFIFDKRDGLDTLDWITKQPWCNGQIGMWGSSYLGFCALIVTPENHPNLKAIFNLSGWGSTYNMTTPGGAMHLMAGAPWTFSNQIRGKGRFSDYDWDKIFRHIPVVDMPSAIGISSQQWEGMVSLYASDELDNVGGILQSCSDVHVPIYHMTGWYDFIGRNTIDTYECVEESGSRSTQKLHVGPWRHDQIWRKITKVGEEDFGPDILMGVEKVMAESIRWFDRWLKDDKNGILEEKPVKIFVMGENNWHEFEQWPPKHVRMEKWLLASDGGANTASGNGKLALAFEGGSDTDTFVFDPINPVPTTGGANFHFFLDNLGIKDQREVEKRDDVLVYTSAPVRRNTDIIGPLQAVIYASTEGKHTDFTAKLVEVRKDGYARIIEEGILRGPDPADGIKPKTMQPGQVYPFTIDMGAIGIRIAKGNRLRLEVSSSNFPKYSRNPNTGESPEAASVFRKVKQTVYHSEKYPSHVLLPVMHDAG